LSPASEALLNKYKASFLSFHLYAAWNEDVIVKSSYIHFGSRGNEFGNGRE
jgi:hypothetical protein